jgi:RNA-directed DNA polymerase
MRAALQIAFASAWHDLVVLCSTRSQAEEARTRVSEILAPLGLRLHSEKTQVVSLARGKEGFDFLGFHHHKVESWKWRGHSYLQRWPAPRTMRAVRMRIRTLTSKCNVNQPVEQVVGELNRVLRGWSSYFRWGNSARKCAVLDSYVHERLAIFLSRKHGLRGRNWGRRYNGAFFRTLGVYALTRTVRHGTAHALR